MTERISRLQLATEQVKLVARRSTCERAQVGAILLLDNRIISAGYAGAPSGMFHCSEVGCLITREGGGCERTVHAEANAIAFAAREGIRVKGAHLFCTLSPCPECAKLIINSGIKEVYYLTRYRKPQGIQLLLDAWVDCYEKADELGTLYNQVVHLGNQ